jgi:hypothetical protein
MLEERQRESMENSTTSELGPFHIIVVQDNNTYELAQMDSEMFRDPLMGSSSNISYSSECLKFSYLVHK